MILTLGFMMNLDRLAGVIQIYLLLAGSSLILVMTILVETTEMSINFLKIGIFYLV